MNALTTPIAFFTRECRAALASRVSLLLPAAGLVAGCAATFTSSSAELSIAAPLFLLQVILYGVPLAAILAATASAHAEAGECVLLTSLPASSLSRASGKFLALLSSFTVASALAVAIPFAHGLPGSSAILLFGYSIGAAAVFTALGLLVGFAIRDGVKAHLAALGVWLALTLGANLAGFLLLASSGSNPQPILWSTLMMLSPLDALRIGILFSIESVPFDTRSIPALARWWLAHPGFWFAGLAIIVTTVSILLASRFTRRSQA